MRAINDILSDIISKIAPVITITNVVDNLDGTYKITVCKKYYLQKCFDITIAGKTYRVEDINGLDITIKGNSLPVVGDFSLYKPNFFHGTVTQTNIELNRSTPDDQKVPMIYSLEQMRKSGGSPTESPNEYIAPLRLFVLTQANFEDWTTNDFFEDAIKPMQELADLFFEQIETYPGLGIVEDRQITDITKFGTYLDSKGVEKMLFNEKLSGVEVLTDLPVLRQYECAPC